MSATFAEAVGWTLGDVAPIIRAALKDKSYQATPLGTLVGRYLRWFRNEWGATNDSVRDYESVLARMAITLADRDPAEITIEDLRIVVDLWAGKEARTRQKVTSVLRSFWVWVEDQGVVLNSPASKLRRPRAPKRIAPLLPAHADVVILAACSVPRDRVALCCLLDLGIRKGGLRGLRPRDFDLARRKVVITEKGQRSRVLPLRGRIVSELDHWLLADLPVVGRAPAPDDFLLYPEKRTAGGRVLVGYPERQLSSTAVHRWWYRQLAAAGLTAKGVTAGLNMHRSRHTVGRDMRRAAGLDSAQHALGHSDIRTTEETYGHFDDSDLERAFEELVRYREAGEHV